MDDPRKAKVLPLVAGEGGAFGGLVIDDAGVRAAAFRKLEEGRPILGELVQLRREEGSPFLDATIERVLPERIVPERTEASGPPQVSTPAYRAGWERVFGPQQAVGDA